MVAFFTKHFDRVRHNCSLSLPAAKCTIEETYSPWVGISQYKSQASTEILYFKSIKGAGIPRHRMEHRAEQVVEAS